MSFGGSSGTSGLDLKKFVSQDEVDEKRKQRQEEWEKVRKPDEPEEFPEEPVDNRCLYDKLEEQKQKAQEEFDEKMAFKNQVKRLDADEAEFLDFVTERQHEMNKARNKEETDLISELKSAQVVMIADQKPAEEKKSKPVTQPSKKSQMALLAGAVKRKGSEDSSPTKKARIETETDKVEKDTAGESQGDSKPETKSSSADSSAAASNSKQAVSSVPIARMVGVRPAALVGLTQYEDSSDSMSSSSDSEIDMPSSGRVYIKQNVQQQQ